ncbi:MAG: mechanosensitive ion channel protein MscL [Cryobacterium sp.]|nr:mechanosensitive ion channel protein MscL [Cryobacterium sp.]
MIRGFKEFVMRGNVIDLAVAVVVGAAFTAVVNAIVEGIFNPLIAAIFSADSLANSMVITLSGDAKLSFGLVLAAIINFLLVAAVVYFAFVLPLNKLKQAQERRRQAGLPTHDAKSPATELDVLTEIRDLLAAVPAEPGKHAPNS